MEVEFTPIRKPVLRTLTLFKVRLVSGLLRASGKETQDRIMLAIDPQQEADLNALAHEVAEEFGLGGADWQAPRVWAFRGHERVVSACLSRHGVPCLVGSRLEPLAQQAFAGREADAQLSLYCYEVTGGWRRSGVTGEMTGTWSRGVGLCLEGIIVRGVPDGLRTLLTGVECFV